MSKAFNKYRNPIVVAKLFRKVEKAWVRACQVTKVSKTRQGFMQVCTVSSDRNANQKSPWILHHKSALTLAKCILVTDLGRQS